MEPRPQRQAAIALVASLALHLALLGFWVWRQPKDIHAAPPAVTVDFEIHETPRPRAAPIPTPPPVAAPTPTPPPVTAVRRPLKAAHEVPPPAPNAAPLPTPAAAPTPAEVAADAEWSTSGVPVAATPAPTKPIDLGAAGTHSAGKVAEAQIDTMPEAQAPLDRSIHAPSQDPNLNRRVASLIDRDRGRRNVERGLVDPYFSELGKALTSSWTLPREVEHPTEKGILKGIGANFLEGLRGWQATAEDWGRTGTTSVGQRTDDGHDEAQAAGDGQAMLNAMNHRGALLVRLTQSRAGRLLDVELVSPSGNAAVDAAVISGLRGGQTVLPVPPIEGQGIKDPIRSLWAFELSIKVCPPAPVLSGNFDIAAPFDSKIGKAASVCVPLDRTIEKHVELLEVD